MRGLYLVTPDWDDTARLLAATEAAIEGGAVCVQYRHKSATRDLRLAQAQAQALRTLTRRLGVPLLINDDLPLAQQVAADGVHLGREDGELAAARAVLGAQAIIGASCYNSLERARAAQAAGASYVAFGAMFASPTKPEAVAAPLELIAQAKAELGLPVACIGGITADNAPLLVAQGADLLAVITDIYAASAPQAQAARFAALYA
ncbi:thiamine phosphate synthase [Uliginosibacterium sediminicola]|uniref:Thiamine-phosphate synthase n=1 Tax=Uliginosibacterium sediminicola TaxID=2024550 RepID=A0ABU9YXP7_9RHOO